MNFDTKQVSIFCAYGYAVAMSAMACSGLIWGHNAVPSLQVLKGASGLAPFVAAAGAVKDSFTQPNRTFYALQEKISLQENNADLAGLTPQQHATLLYGAFNTGLVKDPSTGDLTKPTAENWDASAPLKDARFAGQFIATAIADNARFEIIDSRRDPKLGGLGAVAYRDNDTNEMHVFVVGLETDKPERDALPDLHSLLYDGMQGQIKGLRAFVADLQTRYPGQVRSLTGQSLGTIPASVIAYERQIPYIAVEPRMNLDLAQLVTPDTDGFLKWYHAKATAIEVGANAWNRVRVTSLGKAPPVDAHRTLVMTENNAVMMGAPIAGANFVGGPHQASKSVRPLALGLQGIGLAAVDPKSLPHNAAEVLRARGPVDIFGTGVLGAVAATAAITTAYGALSLLLALKKTQER